MKIIYLHQYFNTPEMSGGTRSYEMARRLVARGHEVHIVTSWRRSSKSKGWFVTKEAGIHVHWLPVEYSNNMSYLRRIIAFFRFAFCAAKKCATIKCDLIFATSTPLTIALPAVYASRRLKVPMVFEVRDLWPELPIAMGALKSPILQKMAYWLERWAYKNAESVVALSPGMRDGVVNSGYPLERVATIPNSSDNDYFILDEQGAADFRSARDWLSDRPLIVYAGTFGRINGVEYLVDLAIELKKINPSICILLVGGGQEKLVVENKARCVGVLGDNFFIEDAISKKSVPALLSAADISCSLFIDLPAMRANSANKFFDALASSKPILLNYGGWQAELVNDFNCGIVTWQMSIQEASVAVANAIVDKEWLRTAGAASKSLAENYFSRDQLAERLESVLLLSKNYEGYKANVISNGDFRSAPL
jgi:glycosyltransferase involved in cell wall biosynthesis